MAQEFIHLRLYSAYSLAKGAIPIKKVPDICRRYNMPAVAVTDIGNMFGALEFSIACRGNGIQPIIGTVLTVYTRPARVTLDGPSKHRFQVLLLAQTEVGYKNLMKLSSDSFLKSEDCSEPEVPLISLAQHSDGIIALSGGIKGPIGAPLDANDEATAEKNLLFLKKTYGDRFYIEIIRDSVERQVEEQTLDLARRHNIPIVATNHVYFTNPDMEEAHDALLCIQQGTFVAELDRMRSNPNYYFKSQNEMKEIFSDLPEAIKNTIVIAKRCSFIPTEKKPMLPHMTFADGVNVDDKLRQKAQVGLRTRLEENGIPEEKHQEYQNRIEYELDVIIKMGFASYFLIVADFIGYAKDHDIAVGPGRGSGAGSLVAYCIRITDVDPIRFRLIFERFLNPERVSMPDFDTDFCQERRDEVIDYVCRKYGASRVAHIITFGTLQARAVIRDVGRVLGLPYGLVDKTSKLVPNNPSKPLTLQEAINVDQALQNAIRSDPQIRLLIGLALKLEGLYRHASTHAAGIVISSTDIENVVPMYKDQRSDVPVTQFNMKMVEKAGLVKFDFLGLKTLTTIQKACELIRHLGKDIDINKIPLDDKKTFQMICNLETVGVFQLESSGMRNATKLLLPDHFEDIISLISLYRPGPMDDIPTYAARKHGTEQISYAHPLIKEILEPTYGVIVYQEQVMLIAQVLAGYSLGQADLLRRAMGKKIQAEMDKHKKRFVTGAMEHGMTENAASALFDQIAKFAGYGFNKSHAAPYALISYQTAYLKCNYPVEFMTATMNMDRGNVSKLSFFRNELSRLGIKLLPPDIQKSDVLFSVEPCEGALAIRYGLGALKGTSEAAMEAIVSERKNGGEFRDLSNFLARFDTQVINKKQLESMIFAGAFDSINPNRRELTENVPGMIRFKNSINTNQRSLFGNADEHFSISNVEEWPLIEKLSHELDAIGFYLSDHPLSGHEHQMASLGAVHYTSLFGMMDGEKVTLCGIVLKVVKKISKTGKQFVFIHMSDTSALFEAVAFSEVLNKYRELLEAGRMLLIKCFVRHDADMLRLTVFDVSEFVPEAQVIVKVISKNHLTNIQNNLNSFETGDTAIILSVDGQCVTLPGRYTITETERKMLRAV